ncbi:hypothetical protein AV530_002587 [Patagioenas fasciata monilis]|uniref:Uncharacterized protein n=1 Tax=Patagioenas fasciata monilis TaxID=372326 RepID=A0A1V4K6Y4_PATFA|nr:hypothetical protein AV530_002587 [Patagioenas fasciata monilis]
MFNATWGTTEVLSPSIVRDVEMWGLAGEASSGLEPLKYPLAKPDEMTAMCLEQKSEEQKLWLLPRHDEKTTEPTALCKEEQKRSQNQKL